jgi:CRISPR-associated protein Csm1
MKQKEYHTLILAGLLHDVGKLLNKPDPRGKKHAVYSVELLQEPSYRALLQDRFSADIDFDLLCYLVVRHDPHVDRDKDIPEYKGPWDLPKHEGLLKRICLADGLSAGERSLEEVYGQQARGTRALDSIFGPLDLGRPLAPLTRKYVPTPLRPAEAFPVEGIEPLTEAHYRPLQDDFRAALTYALEHAEGWDELEAWTYSLLERYTWAVPSAVHREPHDVSLFDHARTSCAIAAALCIRNQPEFAAVVPPRSTFLLIQGDISGVQDYIYSVANVGPGGVAKRLRARSFFITALTEVVTHRLREELVPGYALPIAAQIFGGGGQFVLLAPDLPPVQENLVGIRREVNRWLWEEFQGDLALVAEFLPLTQGDLLIKEGNICQAMDELRGLVEAAKLHRLGDLLQDGDGWVEEAFKWEAKPYPDGDCPSCQRLPARAGEGAPVDDRLCPRCHRDRVLSERIVGARYIAYFRGEKPKAAGAGDGGWLDRRILTLFDGEAARHVVLLADLADLDRLDRQPYQLDGFGYERPTPEGPALVRHFANHVPRFETLQDLTAFCTDERGCVHGCYTDADTCGILVRPDGSNVRAHDFPILQTFGCISAAAAEWPDGALGTQFLGVLRADVDRLGKLFGWGLGEVKSLSRLATLSRMTDLFFSGWVNETLEHPPEGKPYNRIYTVYSGGDDLCLVGPWDVIVDFSRHLAAEFERYVAGNPNVTLSAAISVTKPKFPIATSANKAGKWLDERAKREGRNRLHLFGVTARWRDLSDYRAQLRPEVKEMVAEEGKEKEALLLDDLWAWAKLLDEELERWREAKPAGYPVSTGFAHRLLGYAEMAREWRESGEINNEDLAYLARLAYDLGRNVIKSDAVPDDTKSSLSQLTQFAERKTMAEMRLPITYALYRNRERSRER